MTKLYGYQCRFYSKKETSFLIIIVRMKQWAIYNLKRKSEERVIAEQTTFTDSRPIYQHCKSYRNGFRNEYFTTTFVDANTYLGLSPTLLNYI